MGKLIFFFILMPSSVRFLLIFCTFLLFGQRPRSCVWPMLPQMGISISSSSLVPSQPLDSPAIPPEALFGPPEAPSGPRGPSQPLSSPSQPLRNPSQPLRKPSQASTVLSQPPEAPANPITLANQRIEWPPRDAGQPSRGYSHPSKNGAPLAVSTCLRVGLGKA